MISNNNIISFLNTCNPFQNNQGVDLAKTRLMLDEMCRLYGKFTSYLKRVLCKTRVIFPRINGPIITALYVTEI